MGPHGDGLLEDVYMNKGSTPRIDVIGHENLVSIVALG